MDVESRTRPSEFEDALHKQIFGRIKNREYSLHHVFCWKGKRQHVFVQEGFEASGAAQHVTKNIMAETEGENSRWILSSRSITEKMFEDGSWENLVRWGSVYAGGCFERLFSFLFASSFGNQNWLRRKEEKLNFVLVQMLRPERNMSHHVLSRRC